MARSSGGLRRSALAAVVILGSASGCISIMRAPDATPSQPAFETPGAVLTPGPTSTSSATPTATPTETPTPSPASTPTPAPTPEPTLAPGQTPTPTPIDLLPYMTAGVNVLNLGAGTLFVTVTAIDTDSGDEYPLGVWSSEPLQSTRQAAIPLLLRFDFSYEESTPDGAGTCTMTLGETDELSFVAIEQGVAVSLNGVEPADPAEVVVATSSLCQPGAST